VSQTSKRFNNLGFFKKTGLFNMQHLPDAVFAMPLLYSIPCIFLVLNCGAKEITDTGNKG
jgi:hypothetical protein